jgi:tetratricopeptide (TPR) repeat protein
VAPTGAEPLERDLLDGLGALVDQSLLQRREEGGEEGHEPRFGMRHVIREYALERLQERGETEALGRAHADYYVGLAEQARSELDGPRQPVWVQRLKRDHDNLRAALALSLENGAAERSTRLCVALSPFWNMSGQWNEQRKWFTRTLSVGEALLPRQRADLLNQAGYVARQQGDYAVATRQLEESLALFRRLDDTADVGFTLGQLASLARGQDRFERAEQLYEESLNLLEEAGDRRAALWVLRSQAGLPEARGDYPAAVSIVRQALAIAQELDNAHDIAECRAHLGWLALLQGEGAAVEGPIREALQVQRHMGDANCSAMSVRYLGVLALERGDATVAHALLAESVALSEQIANQPYRAHTLVLLGAALAAEGDLPGAEDAYMAVVRLGHQVAGRQCTAACLDGLAELALAQGQSERAARLLGAAARMLGGVGASPLPLPPRLRAEREQVAARARQALGEAAWEAAFAAGKALSLDEALAFTSSE